MKKVNIELQEEKVQQIAALFTSQKEGLTQSVENYLVLRASTLNSLKGLFNREELITLLDLHNGTMYEPRFTSPSILQAHLEDGELLEGTCTRQGSDYKVLNEKISKLSHAQSLFLIEECWRFWNVETYGQEINNFISKF